MGAPEGPGCLGAPWNKPGAVKDPGLTCRVFPAWTRARAQPVMKSRKAPWSEPDAARALASRARCDPLSTS
eukprot:9674961-Alexandrium_andersonii.AAC.1